MEYNVEAMKIVPPHHCHFFFFSSKTSRCRRKAKMKEMSDVLSAELSLRLHLDNQNSEVSTSPHPPRLRKWTFYFLREEDTLHLPVKSTYRVHYYKLDALDAATARQSLPWHSLPACEILTGCMEQNAPSEKLTVVQLVKKKSRLSRNPNVHYPVQYNPILIPVLS